VEPALPTDALQGAGADRPVPPRVDLVTTTRHRPEHALASVRSPRFLISWWPWRCLTYLVTAAPTATVGVVGVGLLALVWALFVSARLWAAPLRMAMIVVVTLVILLALPPAAVLVARWERLRLALVDDRPLSSGHGPRFPGGGRLRRLFTESATWRETCYLVLMGTVAPLVYAGAGMLVVLEIVLLTLPWSTTAQSGPVVIGPARADASESELPYLLVGMALVPTLLYLGGLLAAGHAAVARALLGPGTAAREVERSRTRLATAYEAERRRIEQDLHDGVQHRLTSLTVHLGLARLDLPEESPAAVSLATAHEQAKDLMVVLRDVVHGIRPQTLTDLGLPGALQDLARHHPLPITVTVSADVPDRLPEPLETTGYFVVAEALTNVTKHSGAGRAWVTVSRRLDCLVIEVRDEGCGGASSVRGTGLTGLADRVAAVGGRLLLSSPEGGPTVVRMEAPWNP
jgi:signal transduction histidine kinase